MAGSEDSKALAYPLDRKRRKGRYRGLPGLAFDVPIPLVTIGDLSGQRLGQGRIDLGKPELETRASALVNTLLVTVSVDAPTRA